MARPLQRASGLVRSLGITYNGDVKPLRPSDLPNPLDGLIRVFNIEIERTWNGQKAEVCPATARALLQEDEKAMLASSEGVAIETLLQEGYEAAGWLVAFAPGRSTWYFARSPPPSKPGRS